ncbi:MAG TPA: transcriptional regulator NrdR [Candidatus Dojkabacteria bacterium]|uniref:Transcriptional repressor NrdR n=1 Tax=Candidatus Dojkabacteria bacterium TaxID=2099670 RepID=A0A847D1R8_9BACT|nr:transcriptional repressor NrdR [Candidatus Dojkabacteria bacterium]NLD25684.1 transcriptional repressor NrdR [Candidatus Dojkabacteria bacterium]HOZ44944.1 transcriptional regulator NrdR [Candidatus Dojkabacteria bacterium]HQC39520.1 transcriptional regulator NrdR [Candidatus Dojkabacteria bacterium]HRY74574.1 transcriptional regulator NrdR [Candidatus Dojkabacteria bacterium]
MKCPFCECEITKVVDKRDNNEDRSTRRRRQCLRCGKRFTTYERLESLEVNVIKKDGSLEKFDSEKIVKGIKKALNHEHVKEEEIRDFAEEIERIALNSEEPLSTNEIGLKTLDWLKGKDKLAYIRFASVYKKFETLEDVRKEIDSIEN